VAVIGCDKDVKNDPTLDTNSGVRPTLDVRGGTSDNEVFGGARLPIAGNSGDGGEIRVSSSGGNITVRTVALVAAPVPPIFVGGLTILSGQTRRFQGNVPTASLRIDAGGVLELTGDTLIRVTGDVQVDGRIDGRGAKSVIDGKNLTIQAGGVVNLLGQVDCSGFAKDPDDVAPAQRGDFAGGSGGEIFISATNAVFVSGSVLAEGGPTFSTASNTAIPGRGGQILIGTTSTLAVGGVISARGGFSYFTPDGGEGHGGTIELVALGDIEIGRARELNASGGPASGATAGGGGAILFEAAIGILNIAGVNLECSGGNATFTPAGVGGNGGTVSMSATNVILTDVVCRSPGGTSEIVDGGEGGDGGSVNVAGTLGVTADTGVFLLAPGGDTNLPIVAGGTGGNVRLMNLAQAAPNALVFNGRASVQGGLNAIGSGGANGFICISGANQATVDSLTGSNNFPISGCGELDVAEVVVHALDCNPATITPSEVMTELPAVLGLDFYFVVVPPGAAVLTISTTGETSGDIDLYAGPAAALGSLVFADYTFGASTGGDSTESIDIDTGAVGLVAGDLISVFVDEAGAFVEEYTITLTGCP